MAEKLKFWEYDADSLLKELDSNRRGLSEAEAERRIRHYGINQLDKEKKRGALRIFVSQFTNPLVVILLFASLISGVLGQFLSTAIIVIMIGFAAAVSFLQEYRSEKTAELLKKRVALQAEVVRDGKIKTILARDLTVGDIVLLGWGKVVPADLRLIEADELTFNEAILTGEPFPVEKESKPQSIRDYLPQAMKNIAFSSSHVVRGSGRGVVVAIGKDTEFGRTAKMIAAKEGKTQFQKGISDFGFLLSKIIIIFSLAVFIFLALFRGDWLTSLLFALSIAVGISPELLPMIITINLSQGARKMAKNSIIVKKLMAVEDLGNADILCTDKTGTLTEGKIFLDDFFGFDGKKDLEIIKFAELCSGFGLNNGSLNPMDQAIVEYAKKHYGDKLESGYKVMEDLAFDFKRRRMSAIVKNKKYLLITKGAAEEMLKVCDFVFNGGKREEISKYLKEIKSKIFEQESRGFRVLLLAYKEIGKKKTYGVKDESGLILSGFLIFADPPKKTAEQTLKMFREMGVSIKILTGDSVESAKYLAEKTGFPSIKAVLGEKLDKMNEDEFKQAVREYDIFAKLVPEHKVKIVKALKELGHNVAFLGDGINDAPALRAADVGISVDQATDVAKEAADVILLKKSLRVLVDGIKEGRKTFGNTLKYIFCTISSNFGNMFSVVGASIILPFIPLLPAQILLLNLLGDFPLLAISTDRVDEEYLKKPKQWDIQKIRRYMYYFGFASSAFDFLTYGFLLLVVKAGMPLFQTGWFLQSFISEVLLIFVVRSRKWFWQSKPSKILFFAMLAAFAAVLFIIYTPVGNYFGFTAIPLWVNITMILMGLGYLFAVEFGKKIFFKKYDI